MQVRLLRRPSVTYCRCLGYDIGIAQNGSKYGTIPHGEKWIKYYTDTEHTSKILHPPYFGVSRSFEFFCGSCKEHMQIIARSEYFNNIEVSSWSHRVLPDEGRERGVSTLLNPFTCGLTVLMWC